MKVKSLSHVRLFATPWTVAFQAPLSMGFSRQEHWSGLPFPSRGDLPDPGIKPRSPTLQVDSLLSEPPEKPNYRQSHQRDGNIKALSVAKVKVLVVQSCPTLLQPLSCGSPDSSVHEISQARILE